MSFLQLLRQRVVRVGYDERHSLDHPVDHPVELLCFPDPSNKLKPQEVLGVNKAVDDAGPSRPCVERIVEEGRRGQKQHSGSRVGSELVEVKCATAAHELGV
eukprot:CAMPEP_0179158490 /NCGR_PEP_ID=MMETSP0796-20121207/77338_1 /TAXON_ID=73915 /ORGANISM="Pyrodinium bahamense, Strain pbaha01" /LENGTH=101 /DNA_ID=CAMNT_0020860165 /DNA_START=101 /DNA_END=403 /DNA_ORIENTATION=+